MQDALVFVAVGTFDYAEDVPGNNANSCSLAIRTWHQCGNHFKVHAASLWAVKWVLLRYEVGHCKVCVLRIRKAVFGAFPNF